MDSRLDELNQAAIGPDGIVRFLSLAQVDLRKRLAYLSYFGSANILTSYLHPEFLISSP